MAFKLRITLTVRCQKHPRYDPAKGEAAIKGGCSECVRTLEVYRRALKTAEEIAKVPGAKVPGVKVTGGVELAKAVRAAKA